MKRLQDNVTLITGGGKGIGFGLATAFAREGSNLVITGRTESRLLSAKERLESEYGIEVLPLVADGADEASVKSVVKAALDRFGKINTLVNNAQTSKSGLPLVEHSKADFDLAIAAERLPSMYSTMTALPGMRPRSTPSSVLKTLTVISGIIWMMSS